MQKPSAKAALNCKHCRFYHGANKLVCAVHPDGPVSDPCGDFAPVVSGGDPPPPLKVNHLNDLSQLRRLRKRLLVAALLLSCIGFGLGFWQAAIHSPPKFKPSPSQDWQQPS